MGKMEEEICYILKKQIGCSCGLKPRYCSTVVDLLNYMLEKCEEEAEDACKKHRVNPSELPLPSIPELNLAEKINKVIPVKVQKSLKEAVKVVADPSVSEFCRQAIIEKIERLREEQAERELEGSG